VTVAKVRSTVAKQAGKEQKAAKAAAAAAALSAQSDPQEEHADTTWDETVWAAPVTDIAAVLDTAKAELKRFIIAPESDLAAVCVWALHTHIVQRDDLALPITPRLGVQAEAEDCGKSTLLESTALMSRRAMLVSSTTAASFFRVFDKYKPTLFIDEGESMFRHGRNIELLQMINAGHSRHRAKVHRARRSRRASVKSSPTTPSARLPSPASRSCRCRRPRAAASSSRCSGPSAANSRSIWKMRCRTCWTLSCSNSPAGPPT
jgi:hypothetical protein